MFKEYLKKHGRRYYEKLQKGGSDMKCPRCDERMVWQSDYMCDEIDEECCGEGVVSYYSCDKCNVEVELKTDCNGQKEEDE
jgi:hypothetical protein